MGHPGHRTPVRGCNRDPSVGSTGRQPGPTRRRNPAQEGPCGGPPARCLGKSWGPRRRGERPWLGFWEGLGKPSAVQGGGTQLIAGRVERQAHDGDSARDGPSAHQFTGRNLSPKDLSGPSAGGPHSAVGRDLQNREILPGLGPGASGTPDQQNCRPKLQPRTPPRLKATKKAACKAA
jgi:hypothetical protein